MSMHVMTPFRAWMVGITILLCGDGAWFASLQFRQFSFPLLFVLWASPAIAGCLTAMFASRSAFALGVSMVIPSVLGFFLVNWLVEITIGPGDYSGPGGAFFLFMATAPWLALLCTAGAILGTFIAKRSASMTFH